MIRDAVKEDIPHMLRMGRKFYDSTYIPETGPYDEESAASTFKAMISNHICLYGDDCMAGAFISPNPYNYDAKIAYEAFWWVEPEARSSGKGAKLFQELEWRAKNNGCTMLIMTLMESSSPESARRAYQSAGYQHCESSYCKVL